MVTERFVLSWVEKCMAEVILLFPAECQRNYYRVTCSRNERECHSEECNGEYRVCSQKKTARHDAVTVRSSETAERLIHTGTFVDGCCQSDREELFWLKPKSPSRLNWAICACLYGNRTLCWRLHIVFLKNSGWRNNNQANTSSKTGKKKKGPEDIWTQTAQQHI